MGVVLVLIFAGKMFNVQQPHILAGEIYASIELYGIQSLVHKMLFHMNVTPG